MRRLYGLTALLWAACGGGGGAESGPADARLGPPDATVAVLDAAVTFDGAAPVDAATPDALADLDAPAAPVVPDPGSEEMAFSWPDTEPNDTPEQAVRLGVGDGQIGPYIGQRGDPGHLGGGDDADYFVFRTSPEEGTTFIANACWSPELGADLLDFALYQVIDGQPLVEVRSSHATSTVCELPAPFWNIPLAPNTKYLFVLTHVAGEGAYQA